MTYFPLVSYSKQDEYLHHFKNKYCHGPIITFDGFKVVFTHKDFDHAFFESSNAKEKDKSIFSRTRAERIDWIEKALTDCNAELKCGWVKETNTYTNKTRIAVVDNNYLVIIRITGTGKARFVTAFVGDDTLGTLLRIKTSPDWYI
jgi:hypothetical protein